MSRLVRGAIPLVTACLVGALASAEEPLARYSGHGVAFSYPADLELEESIENGVASISVENDEGLLVMVQTGPLALDGDSYAEALIEGMRAGLEASGAEVSAIERTRAVAAGAARRGRSFSYRLMGVTNRYSTWGWGAPARALAVSAQYPLAQEKRLGAVVAALLHSIETPR